MSFADELKKMAEDHIVSGSVGPLFDAGWAAACQFWAKKLGEMRLAGPSVPVIPTQEDLRKHFQEWWDMYNLNKLSGDEFACLVATSLQFESPPPATSGRDS